MLAFRTVTCICLLNAVFMSFCRLPCHPYVQVQSIYVHCLLGVFAKLRKELISCMSVRPHEATRLPMDGFQ